MLIHMRLMEKHLKLNFIRFKMIRQERKPRATKYGEFYALVANYIIQTIPVENQRPYAAQLIKELKKYSLKPRPKGTPRNEGCVHELEDIVLFDIRDPKHFARFIKEGIHLMYLKPTAKRVLEAIINGIKSYQF